MGYTIRTDLRVGFVRGAARVKNLFPKLVVSH